MEAAVKPYVQAGRVLRFLAWLQIVVVVGIAVAISVPVLTNHKDVSASLVLLAVLSITIALGIAKLFFMIGTAVKEHKEWGRKAGIVIGVLQILGFPIGTLIGAYLLWVLISKWDDRPVVQAAAA